jgi:hypothetical protein
MLSAVSVLPLPENRIVRVALAALVLTCIVMLALAMLHVGDASAAKKDGWYKCWIEGYGEMWCKDV